MATLERAISIAAEAHAGQIDKAGAPYILHPLRVMLGVERTEERMAAVLHDVVEDTDWTIERLRAEGFPTPVLTAIEAVTRRRGEGYEEFIRRAALDPIGREVKLADVLDNLDITRIGEPTARDVRRLERYRRARQILDTQG